MPCAVRRHLDERKALDDALAAATMQDECDRMGDGYCAPLERFAIDPARVAATSEKPSVKPVKGPARKR